MQKTSFTRADGRYVCFYSFDAPPPRILAIEEQRRPDDRIELRHDTLRGEWVAVSTARQQRTFLPPAEYCPLCPTASESSFATEIPAAAYEIAVFENRFPSLRPDAPDVTDDAPLERRMPARGFSEVVLYTSAHEATLASLPPLHVRRLVDVWSDRYADLSARDGVQCVFIFENRGKEIGVTLTHPHGQIYAFPYVPPRIEHERDVAGGRCLLCRIVASEAAGPRVVATAPGFVAYVPFAARLPYEVHVATTEHRASLLELSPPEREGLAAIFRDVQGTYDALWDRPMPYTMSMHQAPVAYAAAPSDHLHIEFAPPYRTRDKLKYLAGVETGAGTFINDTAPEEKAQELREARARLSRA